MEASQVGYLTEAIAPEFSRGWNDGHALQENIGVFESSPDERGLDVKEF